MARPLRIEYEGAIYHVISRGDRREDIYDDDIDRTMFLNVLGSCVERFNWLIHAYCLMSNHYHLLIETPEAQLSRGMRQLNGVYTQRYNHRHGLTGHLYQGRFKGILVQKENYLLEVARYIVLNPVRAGLVRRAADWRWSSYRATACVADDPRWLSHDRILDSFGDERAIALRRYRDFVDAGSDRVTLDGLMRNQVFLGDESFVEQALARIDDNVCGKLSEVPRRQRAGRIRKLAEFSASGGERNNAIRAAHTTGGYTLKEIGDHFGLHYSTISRIVSCDAKRKT